MASKHDLYRAKPVSNFGKFFALLTFNQKKKFFYAENFTQIKTLSWQKVLELSTQEEVVHYGKLIKRVEKTLFRIFLAFEIEKYNDLFREIEQSTYFSVVDDTIVFTDYALSLIK